MGGGGYHGNLQVTHKLRNGSAVAVTTDTTASLWKRKEESERAVGGCSVLCFLVLCFFGFIILCIFCGGLLLLNECCDVTQ